MSLAGHSRPIWAVGVMSALPPVATLGWTSRFGGFVPIAALAGERVLVRSELQFLVRVECYGVRILDQ
jgi:hypothetical protein